MLFYKVEGIINISDAVEDSRRVQRDNARRN